MDPPGAADALAALERLYQKRVVTLEEGQRAAQLLSGDERYVFPAPPRPRPAPAPRETGAPAGNGAGPPPAGAEGGEGNSPGQREGF